MFTAPPETPVTTPEVLTVAIEGFALVQVPPAVPVASVRVIVDASHTTVGPVIVPATGSAKTVIT